MQSVCSWVSYHKTDNLSAFYFVLTDGKQLYCHVYDLTIVQLKVNKGQMEMYPVDGGSVVHR